MINIIFVGLIVMFADQVIAMEIDTRDLRINSHEEKGSKKDGRRVGVWRGFHRNGKLYYQGSYDNNGEPDGSWTFYFPNGRIADKGSFKNGFRVGKWVGYFYNGEIMYQGSYKDNYEWGLWEIKCRNGKYHVNSGTYHTGNKIEEHPSLFQGEVVSYCGGYEKRRYLINRGPEDAR